MAIEVACPSCNRHFNAPDNAAGKKAQCPTCGGVIVISSGAIAAPPVDAIFDAEPTPERSLADDDLGLEPPATLSSNIARKPCPMCGEMIAADAVKCRFCGEIFDSTLAGVLGTSRDMRDPGWRKVRSGLTTLLYCNMIVFSAILVIFSAGAVFGAMNDGAEGMEKSPGTMVAMVVGGLTILVGGIGVLVGHVRCTNVPAVSGARGCAIGAVICFICNIFFSMAASGAGQRGGSQLGSLLNMVGAVLFIVFIRRAATYLGDRHLATSAGRFIAFGVVAFMSLMFAIIVAVAVREVAVIVIAGTIAIVLMIAAFVWYLRLIISLRRTIDQRMPSI